ncbi:hypothetical protein RJ640_014158, partial [Escallonia rubra]
MRNKEIIEQALQAKMNFKERKDDANKNQGGQARGRGRGRNRGRDRQTQYNNNKSSSKFCPSRGQSRGGYYQRQKKKDVKYFTCHRYGHYSWECRNDSKEESVKADCVEENKLGNDTVLLPHDGSKEENENSWYLDTNTNNHICGYKYMFIEMDESVTGNINFVDMSKIPVKGKGKILTKLKNRGHHFISKVSKKLDDKSEKFIFISYSQQPEGYKLYNHVDKKMKVSRDVTFNEKSQWDWTDQGNDVMMFDYFKKKMAKEFEIIDIGFMSYYLGIELMQRDDVTFISQDAYAKEVLKEFNMKNCNPISNLIKTEKKLSRHIKGGPVDRTLFQSLVRILRLKIAALVHVWSKAQSSEFSHVDPQHQLRHGHAITADDQEFRWRIPRLVVGADLSSLDLLCRCLMLAPQPWFCQARYAACLNL